MSLRNRSSNSVSELGRSAGVIPARDLTNATSSVAAGSSIRPLNGGIADPFPSRMLVFKRTFAMLFLPGPRREVRDGAKARSHGNAITLAAVTSHAIPLKDGGNGPRRITLSSSGRRRRRAGDPPGPVSAPTGWASGWTSGRAGLCAGKFLRDPLLAAAEASNQDHQLVNVLFGELTLHRRHRLLPCPDHASELVIGARSVPAGIGEIRSVRTRLPGRFTAAVGVVALDAMPSVKLDRLARRRLIEQHAVESVRRSRIRPGSDWAIAVGVTVWAGRLEPTMATIPPTPTSTIELWEIEPNT